ncbi:hypothetical protein EOT10_29585 [Streptomyces antnestii]|uniref:DUF3040 domain-containing protein n=1 Tax=Streptomyces antnestii TaxID=2494256 RepID=A0A3S2VAA5_9ACTN|nr:hypothetical protein [Streptomyces sp. San01]RVU19628.1 hypothetical protein EOT10_29585 [Streptomyces sp. San01]
MNGQARMEREVRAILDGAQGAVPPEIHPEAVRRGGRMLRRRRVLRRLTWLALCLALTAFFVWVLLARPWVEPPSKTTPPLTGW